MYIPQPKDRDRFKQYAIIIITCLILSFLATFKGCAEAQEKAVRPPCVPQAIMCAWGWEIRTGEEVRLAVSHIIKGVDHVQAMAYHRGGWTYLTVGWDSTGLNCQPSQRHFTIYPYRFVSLGKYTREQLKERRLAWNKKRSTLSSAPNVATKRLEIKMGVAKCAN